jgi:OOP family OmpA-OmpF porin
VDRLMTDRQILFEQGSSNIADDPASRGLLDQLAGVLGTCPSARVSIEGHTNSDGARDRNLTLSEARARAVLNALTARGLPGDRFQAVGFGPDKPLIPHGSEEARERNRRVQFSVSQ